MERRSRGHSNFEVRPPSPLPVATRVREKRSPAASCGRACRVRNRGGLPFAPARDLVNVPIRKGDDEQVPVRARLDVGDDAESLSDLQRLAFERLSELDVVVHAILEAGLVHSDLAAVPGEVEPEELTAFALLGIELGRADEEVV